MSEPALLMDHQSRIVLLLSRGTKYVQYINNNGHDIGLRKMPIKQFDAEYNYPVRGTPLHYAERALANKVFTIRDTAARMLKVVAGVAAHTEVIMSERKEREPKTSGPVFIVHDWCDHHRASIESGKVVRHDAVAAVVALGVNPKTAATQVQAWSKKNCVAFVRPAKVEKEKEKAAPPKVERAADRQAEKKAAPKKAAPKKAAPKKAAPKKAAPKKAGRPRKAPKGESNVAA